LICFPRALYFNWHFLVFPIEPSTIELSKKIEKFPCFTFLHFYFYYYYYFKYGGVGLTFLVDNLRYSITKAFIVAFLLTFFSMLDVPVFWPILLCYWGVLFVLTMKRQILHMIKYKYVPFTVGKQVSYIGY